MNKLKKYGIILTTIMTIFTSSLIMAKAAGTQVSIHYVYPFYAENTGYHDAVISVEFADYTEGSIVLTLTDWSSYRIMPIGARLSNISNTTNRFTFQVDDCKQFLIYMVPIAAVASATVYPEATVYSNNTSYVEHLNQSYIESQFSTTNGYIDDLESTCNTIKTDVHNIYLQLVDQALDLDNIQAQLTSIGNYLYTTNQSLTTLNNSISLIMQQIQQIDNQIDTISWQTGTYTATVYSDYNNQTLSKSNVFYVPINQTFFNRLINIRPFNINAAAYKFANVSNVEFFGTNGNNVYGPVECTYFTDLYQSSLNLYVFCSNVGSFNSSYGYYLKITFDTDIIVGTSSFPNFMNYITETDIEYWKLLQTFNQFQYQKEQLNLTQELIDIVSQLSSGNSTETTENITNFNTNMEIVNNIETNLSTDFGNSKTIFDFNESDKWTFDEDLIRPTSTLNSVFTATINALPPADTWLSLILLCAVLLAILG